MPFNGSGTFSRLYSWVVDAANNINILSTKMDAEMNGMAAALTNCVTRDGQSPPSADLPWGGKKITNLGLATVGTDALSQNAGDARYLFSGSALPHTITFNNAGSGAASGAVFDVTANITVSYNTLGAAPLASPSFTGNMTLATNNVALKFTDANAGTPFFGCQNDNLFVFRSTDGTGAARLVFSVLCHSGSSTFDFAIAPTCPTPSPGDNSTKVATTAFIAGFAPLASPALTGTPTAPTAAAGTATTQLATTAFVDALRDVPSNAYTTSQTLTLAHRGQGADFNGTSLTCTIPANASVAFPVGTTIVLTNINSTSLSIAITTDTLTLAGTTTTGTRTLAQNGMATLRKITATSWLISGAGLS